MIISIPTFDEILKLLKFDGDKNEISLEYVAILSDFQNKTDLFIKLFKKVRNKIRELSRDVMISYDLIDFSILTTIQKNMLNKGIAI